MWETTRGVSDSNSRLMEFETRHLVSYILQTSRAVDLPFECKIVFICQSA
jgi:hypothetical protein